MPQVINTNIASLTAQRALSTSQSDVNTALQRLSTGMRINGAKDDAAGLAISERFNSQIKGLNQAARNSNDAISLAQTADNALSEVTNNLQRIRELAVQSANSSNSSSDRAALQTEVSQLVAEIDRVASQTKFNGISLLDGTFASQAFQVGADSGQTISVSSIVSAASTDLGRVTQAVDVGVAATAALTSGQLLINGNNVGAVTTGGTSGNYASSLKTAIENADGTVTATVGSSSATVGAFATVSDPAEDDDGVYTLIVEGVTVHSETDLGSGGSTVTAAEIDTSLASNTVVNNLTSAGVTFSGTAAGGDLVFTKADGSNLRVTETRTAGDGGSGALTGNGFASVGTGTAAGNLDAFGSVTLASDSSIVVAGTASTNAGLAAGSEAVALQAGTTLSSTTVATVTGANAAITSIDNALNTISSGRATLGALQNRFDSVVANLQTASENASAARSRIVDADFAAETAALTRGQILQQAGIAVLAQANAAPQNVLALLQ